MSIQYVAYNLNILLKSGFIFPLHFVFSAVSCLPGLSVFYILNYDVFMP